jgi:hypothetical protein
MIESDEEQSDDDKSIIEQVSEQVTNPQSHKQSFNH